jgi:hypothetical protein
MEVTYAGRSYISSDNIRKKINELLPAPPGTDKG